MSSWGGRRKRKKEEKVEETREGLSEVSETLSWRGWRRDAEPHFRGIKVNGSCMTFKCSEAGGVEAGPRRGQARPLVFHPCPQRYLVGA